MKKNCRIIALLAVIMCGCSQPPDANGVYHDTKGSIRKVYHEGHVYLECETHYSVSMSHHPDCPCLNDKKIKPEI